MDMRVGALSIGFFTFIVAVALFIYGLCASNPADPITGMVLSIIGMFLGMAALLIIYIYLFSGSRTFG